MFKSFFTNSSGILFSRILGFIRDLLSASILGANIYSDIFFMAFKLPNLFRRIFAEGSFTQSFIPAYSKSIYKPSFAYHTLKKFFIIILIISVFVTIFSPFVTEILAFGFSEQIKLLASPLVAINFYYLDFIFLVAFFAALLQYHNHFATTAYSTALLNISLIIALLLSYDKPPLEIVYYLSFGVLAGGGLQVIAHLLAIKKYKIDKLLIVGCKSKKNDIKAKKEFNKNFWHSIVGNSTLQLGSFLDTWLATFLVAGNISFLYYANRVFQLPLALFAIAMNVAIFPGLSKHLHKKRFQEALLIIKKGFWFLIVVLGMASIVGFFGAKLIIWLLFQRGAFSAYDAHQTAFVLQMYILGLLPYGVSKIFSSYLYSLGKHKKVSKISIIALIANILFSLLLIAPMGASGLALASSLAGWILLFLNIKEFGFDKFKQIISPKSNQ